mgnify:FL=1
MIKMKCGLGLLAATAMVSVLSARADEAKIYSGKAAFHVGEAVMACGKVSEVRPFNKGYYLNLGDTYPKQHLSLLVWQNKTPAFTERFGALQVFTGKEVCARGTITEYHGQLQMVMTNPQFLRLMK